MVKVTAPPVAFLGVCDRASQTPLAQNVSQLNVLGLRNLIITQMLPMPLDGVSLLFSAYAPALADGFHLVLRNPSGEQVGELRAQSVQTDAVEQSTLTPAERREYVQLYPGAWVTNIISVSGEPRWLLTKPGVYTFFLDDIDAQPVPVGSFHVLTVQAEALSEARIAAIRSDPHATKMIKLEVACTKCRDSISPYVGLERSDKAERDGCTWYASLPDFFTCSCGAFSVNLETLRSSMHGLLGRPLNAPALGVVPLYESVTLQSIGTELTELLDADPVEEELQRFLAQNLVALHTIAPAQRIFLKAPILTKHKTDFAILTPGRDLVLVEIERAGTRLMKADGGLAAPLQHAFDQVNGWMHTIAEHRAAVLHGIGLKTEEVSRVRFVVVAGRDRGYDYEDLRRLKARDFGSTMLMTYDDLVGALHALANELRQI